MAQADPPIAETLGTPVERAIIEPLFRQHARGGLTLHAAINAVVLLLQRRGAGAPGTPRVPTAPSHEPGLPSHPTSDEILTRLEAHREWCESMAVVLWDEHARAAMRQAANNFELAMKYIREKPNV
jgi:hypothetical protein